ncbi:hypothetical protein [Nocardia cerradoensis]|uniref:Uncharacterized protein n=1 Tax=Nocardia cerradoensis TaxID=85688 RepID=A0A231H5E8_9NOCA|nr:hypothetical protein [Nocardia cerradoensis]NKY44275.1 hypothetical protein [Nocardia cerradoensis]OXR44012.1 hypothetical protein B7C42_03568 [Nocardia cerradoensis]
MSTRPRTGTDVAVRIRLREDFAEDPDFDPQETFVLQLADELPDVCTRHGEVAIEQRDKDFDFRPKTVQRSAEQQWVQRTAAYEVRFLLRGFYRIATFRWVEVNPPSTVLEGTWPICTKCKRTRQLCQYTGHAIVLLGLAAILVILAATQTTTSAHLPVPLVLAVFPGWGLFGLIAAYLLYRRSTTFVSFRPIADLGWTQIRAHPRFAEAFESRGTVSGRG